MCGELTEKKIDEIEIGPYVGVSHPSKPLCEPSFEQIERAIRDEDFDERGYQEHLEELVAEWNKDCPDFWEYNRHEQQYHARRIAHLAVNGWSDDDPIILKKDGRSVHDGLHRLKAAKHLGKRTVKVRICPDAAQ
jgi:hypothetical protein